MATFRKDKPTLLSYTLDSTSQEIPNSTGIFSPLPSSILIDTLSALWVADSQFYIDGQLRFGNFDGSTGLNGRNTVDIDGSGYEISVEVGRSFELPNEWTLILQVQVMYSDIDKDDVPDRVEGGWIESLVDGDTLTARVELRAERAFANNSMMYGQNERVERARGPEFSLGLSATRSFTKSRCCVCAKVCFGEAALRRRRGRRVSPLGQTTMLRLQRRKTKAKAGKGSMLPFGHVAEKVSFEPHCDNFNFG